MYIFITLLSALFLGSYEVLKKVSLKKSSIYETLFFYCFSAFLVSLLFAYEAINIGLIDILLLLGKSGIIVLNWFLVLKCMEKLDVAIVVGFSLLNTILIVFGSSLFFFEQITWLHFISMFFIGGGIILIGLLNRKESNKEVKNSYRYLFFLVIASVLGACSGLLDKYVLSIRKVSPRAALIWFMFFTSLIYGIIYFIKNKRIEFKKLKSNYALFFTGACIALADTTYYGALAMDGAQVSLISIMRKFSVIVATVLASLFLREKHLWKKLGILIVMLIGVSLPLIFA